MSTASLSVLRWSLVASVAAGGFATQDPDDRRIAGADAVPTISTARQLFYDGNYEASSAEALALRTADPNDLAVYELRTTAVLFQLKRLLGDPEDKNKALKACGPCPALIATFMADVAKAQVLGRARVKTNSKDAEALFFLGKTDLNYVWLQLGTLGKRTGWTEYWEARHSLDALLKLDPTHVRGRVARAWIDYIVDTKMTRGFKWILGGGNKKKALVVMGEAARADADVFTRAEARFGLWEMQMREKNVNAAVLVAQDLARDFPSNREVADFLKNPNKTRSGGGGPPDGSAAR